MQLTTLLVTSIAAATGALAAPTARLSTTTTTTTTNNGRMVVRDYPGQKKQGSGCGRSPQEATKMSPGEFDDFTTAKDKRQYRVWLPESYDENEPTPLILSYHGHGGDIDNQIHTDNLHKKKFNKDHIVVYMQGLPKSDEDPDATAWQGSPDEKDGVDDVGFTEEVLDTMHADFCIDADRTYVTGFSQGGGMVGVLACSRLSPRIAAFAPVSGAFYRNVSGEDECDPAKIKITCGDDTDGDAEGPNSQVRMMGFHGGADDTVAFKGGMRKGSCLPDIRHFYGSWGSRLGLEQCSVLAGLEGSRSGGDQTYWRRPGEVELAEVSPAQNKVTLVYTGNDMGHVWPSESNGGFEASSMIMDFFQAYTLSSP